MRNAKIAIIGTLDTKGEEFEFLAHCLRQSGVETIMIDVGVQGNPRFEPDISRHEIAVKGGSSIERLVSHGDRGKAMDVMMVGAAIVSAELQSKGEIDGMISLGGSAGTTIGTAAMRALPVGMPKLMVSTVACGDISPYIGGTDITMMYSVVDISGINRISKLILMNAAHAIAGMARGSEQISTQLLREKNEQQPDKPLLAATMFGVTTPCVMEAKRYLEERGYEVLVFHATGAGGRSMEVLIEAGFIAGVLDVTTTELADELVGGVFSAGTERLEAAGRKGIPQVVSVGALDMVNFGSYDTVPDRFKHRNLYHHNASVTLMRTTVEENRRLGERIAEKLNETTGPCAVFLPLGGVSILDAEGQPFHGALEDEALFAAVRSGVAPNKAEVIELACNINDPSFALAMAQRLERMLNMQ
jgi:uncharacterized protein (UPF0261 family)